MTTEPPSPVAALGGSWASSPQARAVMRANRARDTGPEMRLRRELHRRGARYRVQVALLPRRRVDVVFPGARVAVDVRGCFWHACPEHGTDPRSNSDYWHTKLAANVARDADTASRLLADGWLLVVVWEHEDPVSAADRVLEAVAASRRPRPGRGVGNRRAAPLASEP